MAPRSPKTHFLTLYRRSGGHFKGVFRLYAGRGGTGADFGHFSKPGVGSRGVLGFWTAGEPSGAPMSPKTHFLRISASKNLEKIVIRPIFVSD